MASEVLTDREYHNFSYLEALTHNKNLCGNVSGGLRFCGLDLVEELLEHVIQRVVVLRAEHLAGGRENRIGRGGEGGRARGGKKLCLCKNIEYFRCALADSSVVYQHGSTRTILVRASQSQKSPSKGKNAGLESKFRERFGRQSGPVVSHKFRQKIVFPASGDRLDGTYPNVRPNVQNPSHQPTGGPLVGATDSARSVRDIPSSELNHRLPS